MSRKALAPKCVNNSQRKNGKLKGNDEIKATKINFGSANEIDERVKEKRQELQCVRVLPDKEPTSVIVAQLEPETPAGLDLFSPLSSEPSNNRLDSRDTPPPPDLGAGTEGQRASRRSRGSVSYAEPNLRDKMRRPTKELVDAVLGDAGRNRGSISKLEEESDSISHSIKAEPEADNSWKNMPIASSSTVENSPLRSKTAVPESLPSTITTHRKRRESILNGDESLISQSASSSSLAALLEEGRKAKAIAKAKSLETAARVGKTAESVDIYDFRSSSPTSFDEGPKKAKDNTLSSKQSARRVSIKRGFRSVVENTEDSDVEGPVKVEDLTSRRRQSAVGSRDSSTTSSGPGKEIKELKTSGSLTSFGQSVSGTTRNDRASARRKSMML